MKTRMKSKSKRGKAIIGIAMAAIIIASVMAAMVAPAAAWVRTARPVTPAAAAPGPTVVIGELVTLPVGITQIQYATSDGAGGYIPTGQVLSVTTSGVDTAPATTAGVYITNLNTYVSLTDPTLTVSIRLAGTTTEVSSVVAGQALDVVVNTNIPGADPLAASANTLKIVVKNKETGITTTAGVAQGVAPWTPMWTIATGVGNLGTGGYEITVKTNGAAGAAIDIASTTKDMTVRTQAIDVVADPTEQTIGNDVLITTKAGAGVQVVVQIAAGPATFDPNKGDWGRAIAGSTATGTPPAPDGTNRPTFVGTVPSDGTLVLVIASAQTGSVTIRAGIDSNPPNGIVDLGEITDTTALTIIREGMGVMLLHENWNFLSVPKELAEGNNTFEQVFDTVNTSEHSIFYYNTTEGWRAVTASEEVKPLRGYWVYSAEETRVILTYDTYPLRTPPTRQLYKGWNAIGFSDTTAAPANSALTSIEKSWAYLIGFDADNQEYESAIINNDETGGVHDEDNLMYPMEGYWVYVTEDCELAGISV